MPPWPPPQPTRGPRPAKCKKQAAERAAQAASDHRTALEQAQTEAALDEQRKSEALASRDRAVESANADASVAEQCLDEGSRQARDAVREWTEQVRAWQAEVVYLSPADIRLPAPDADPAELDTLDPAVQRRSGFR